MIRHLNVSHITQLFSDLHRKGLKPGVRAVNPALPTSLKLRGTSKGGVNGVESPGFSPLRETVKLQVISLAYCPGTKG